MTLKRVLKIVLVILGLAALSAMVWFGGPLVAFGDSRLLEEVTPRAVTIGTILLVAFLIWLTMFLVRRRREKALEAAVAAQSEDDTDTEVLSERLKDALATLKKSSRWGRNYLYELPWYLVIGPPGAGKTTALVNSGLRFPLARGSAAEAVQGSGGTRYCDWWFTENAVLIDTAGRYTTQDADRRLDSKSWLGFLDILKLHRPFQPINGVLVVISLEDVITGGPQEIQAHSEAIRKRLGELHERLKVSFPVYVVFTKADLVAGFMEYFADLGEDERKAVWGATFQTDKRDANMIGGLPAEYDALVSRLAERMPDRLNAEVDPRARALMFGFPGQMNANKAKIVDFMNRIFEPTRYQVTATLRGFYFTSGTQIGTPFDQLIGNITRSLGTSPVQGAYSGLGKSFFLHDLITRVVIPEAGWVSSNAIAVRRTLMIRIGAFAAVGLLTAGALAVWLNSYRANAGFIQLTQDAVKAYEPTAAAMAQQTEVSDPKLDETYEALFALWNLPPGYRHREEPPPPGSGFGLSQHERLESAATTTYRNALETFLRPRLVLRLEQQIQEKMDNPVFLYEALKVYLMLGGQYKADRETIVRWQTYDWENNVLPGPTMEKQREVLTEHLQAMLDLETSATPAIKLNLPLVEATQQIIARMPLAQRGYSLMKADAAQLGLGDWRVADHAGVDASILFETEDGSDLETLSVPGIFTYQGFRNGIVAALPTIQKQIESERWVLGRAADQAAFADQYPTLERDILDLYETEFISKWDGMLSSIRLKSVIADKPSYGVLGVAASGTSPILQLAEGVAAETRLTAEPAEEQSDAAADAAGGVLAKKAQQQAASALGATGGAALNAALKASGSAGPQGPKPGQTVEDHFAKWHDLVEPGANGKPVEKLTETLGQIQSLLALQVMNPEQSSQTRLDMNKQMVVMQNHLSKLPGPLQTALKKVVDQVSGDVVETSIGQLADELANRVTGECRKIASNVYPFARSERDVAIASFGQLFSPGGIMDGFFVEKLAPLVDMSTSPWSWRTDNQMTSRLSNATLRSFEIAATIRDAFFPTGGKLPQIQFQVQPVGVSAGSDGAVLEMDGTSVFAGPGGGFASNIQWPSVGGRNQTAVYINPQLPDRASSTTHVGPWGLFRLADQASLSRKGNVVRMRVLIGGREAVFSFTSQTTTNPLGLDALSKFRCPDSL